MRQLLYLIGPPGSGKSTLFRELTVGVENLERRSPFAHVLWQAGAGWIAELGARRAAFSGTDALSMSVQPKVKDWLSWECPVDRVIGEGDRLANDGFFEYVEELGWKLTVLHLSASPEVLAARRAARAQLLGAPKQNAGWLRGRETKVARLAERWAKDSLNGGLPTSTLVEQLRALPIFRDLGSEEEAA